MNNKEHKELSKVRQFKKILHIWDFAGVSCILAKYLRSYGYESKVLMRKSHDPIGIIKYYNESSLRLNGRLFLEYSVLKSFNYDIIHVHGLYKLIPKLRKIYPKKKIVLHHHGLDIKWNKEQNLIRDCEKMADLVITASKQLQEFVDNSVYLPTIIDTELFKPINIKKTKEALLMSMRYLDMNMIQKFLVENNCPYNYDILDREKNHIQYHEMPEFLNQYKTLIDIKISNGVLTKAMSKTSLEALACGLDVYNYELKIIKKLPDEHKPENVVKKLISHYKEINDIYE